MASYYVLDPSHPGSLGFECTVLALGMFDGVHVGHGEILRKAREVAAAAGGRSVPVAVTLDRHPASSLGARHVPPLITDLDTKVALIQSAGIDTVVVMTFDRAAARIEPRDFARHMLKDALHASSVVVGFNYTFGRGARGTPATLSRLGAELGFDVVVVPPVSVRGATVGSTVIRSLVTRGRVDEAAGLLGRLFSLTGTVGAGAGRGHGLGFPTANLTFPPGILTPPPGVYAVQAALHAESGRIVPGVMNLGTRPTFRERGHGSEGGQGRARPEVHLLDYDGDLYGTAVTVGFVKRLRSEVAFADGDALARQIAADIGRARSILQGTSFVIQ